MRITYVVHARFPTEKAYGKQIAEVCSTLARLGHEVTAVCPTIQEAPAPSEYYGLEDNFKVAYLHHWNAWRVWIPGFLRSFITTIFYGRAVRRYLKEHEADLLYTRSPLLLPDMLNVNVPVVLELHTLPQRAKSQFVSLCHRCALVVCLTHAMRDELVGWGVDVNRTKVEADGVDLARFENLPSRDQARLDLKFPNRPVIGYVGSLVTRNTIEKGVAEFLKALAILVVDRKKSVFGFIVGGPSDARHTYQEMAVASRLTKDDVALVDRVPASAVPPILTACDVLVYPAPASDHPYFQRDTSPLKLFEYLAAGRPVVCADIPPLRDVVDETVVRFCKPGDAESLASAISEVLEQKEAAHARTEKGKSVAAEHSWEKRMGRILARVQNAL